MTSAQVALQRLRKMRERNELRVSAGRIGPMIALVALRNFTHRPLRTAFLMAGYGIGVGVMIVLLSIGEALLAQARDEKLVGGGEITVLPQGLDVEVMKTGGLGGLFFSINQSRFVYRQLLASPRLADDVRAVAPQIEGRLLYLRAGDREYPVRASGEIPSRSEAVGSVANIIGGTWTDDDGDRRWLHPTPAELRREVDSFHLPPAGVNTSSWAEWHYFNVLSADRKRWAFISFILAGDIPDGRWGGQVLVTLHEDGGSSRRFTAEAMPERIQFSTGRPDLTIGGSTVTLLPDGNYAVEARAREEGGSAEVSIDLVVAPVPRAYFPAASLGSGDFVSGYAVAALRADATGTLCVASRCERYEGAQSYHDHNWGVWQGVTWEWGSARTGEYSLLYGRVNPPDSLESSSSLFLILVDSLGFRAIFRPQGITYEDARTVRVGGREIRVPARGVMQDIRGSDTLRVELEVEDATATDMREPAAGRGDASGLLERPYFVQMKGVARVSGRVGGVPVAGEGTGFFETYR